VELVQHIFATYGFVGLWAIVAFEAFEFVFSIPIGPVIVVLGGLASQGAFPVWKLWLVAWTAVIAGDNLGFLVGRVFGRPILNRFGTKLVRKSVIDRAEQFFVRYGTVAVFFTRFIVATVAAPLNVIAGASDLQWRKFTLASALGQAGWATIYVFLGYFFGKQIGGYVALIAEANVTLISFVTIIAVLAFAWFPGRAMHHHVRFLRQSKQKPENESKPS
jgi:membrane-associated protein